MPARSAKGGVAVGARSGSRFHDDRHLGLARGVLISRVLALVVAVIFDATELVGGARCSWRSLAAHSFGIVVAGPSRTRPDRPPFGHVVIAAGLRWRTFSTVILLSCSSVVCGRASSRRSCCCSCSSGCAAVGLVSWGRAASRALRAAVTHLHETSARSASDRLPAARVLVYMSEEFGLEWWCSAPSSRARWSLARREHAGAGDGLQAKLEGIEFRRGSSRSSLCSKQEWTWTLGASLFSFTRNTLALVAP
jgi:hypothetical protein